MDMIVSEIEPKMCADRIDFDSRLFYIAVTQNHFFVYDHGFRTWTNWKNNHILHYKLEKSFDSDGCVVLPINGIPTKMDNWFVAESMDDVLDFYNSEEYLQYI